MLLNIQVLRATAALLVVVVHLEALGRPLGLQSEIFDLFAVGVDLFFVISGFIMVHATRRHPLSPGRFLLNRLLRIAPLYWLLTLGVFALALASPGLLGTTAASWPDFLRSLAFVPYQRMDGTMRPMLFVGWSLNLEMAFYALFAATLTLKDRNRGVLAGVLMLAGVVGLGAVMGTALPAELRFLSQPLLLEFAGGMAIGWLYPHLPASAAMARGAAIVGIIALSILVLVARWPLPGGWPVSLPPACLAVLAALVAEKGGLRMHWQPALVLGNASYALYLTHPFVTQAWAIASIRSGLLSPATAPALIVAAIACAIAVGLLVHLAVERPLERLTRQIPATPMWQARLRNTPAAEHAR
ncbi:acyltransferase family protein [Novosphingobium soli]|uniref:Acyltransferase family protein n=1 Tax=Novosphingobium soli TaxID=574956 RepID=A0ABV6CPZ4_9SPHN